MPYLGLQPSFTAGEVTPELAVRVDLAKYQSGCLTLENMLIHPQGGASKRWGFEYLGELPGPARLIPFIFSAEQAYVLAFCEFRMFVFTADGPMVDDGGNIYSIEVPYTYEAALLMDYAQSADVMYIASHYSPPVKISRYGHADWRPDVLTFTPKIDHPYGLTGELYDNRTSAEKEADGPSDKAWRFVVTAISESGEESLPSDPVAVMGPENLRSNCYPKLYWAAHPYATEYRVYQEQSGKFGYIGSVDAIDVPYFDAKNFDPVMTDTPPQAKNPFEDGNYPGTVCFYQQRLAFGGSLNRPQTIWMSRSGNYENFSTSSPLKDDDAIEVTIASNEVSLIKWMIPLRGLIIGTSGVEWVEKKGTNGETVTPTNIFFDPQSYRGSSHVPAVIIGNTLLHVSRSYREVRDLLYDFGSDSYGGVTQSILATHLLKKNRIINWAYQQSPDSILWSVRDDGALLGFTYMREHEVFAWHRHLTEGEFQYVCCIPGIEGDDLFALVKREVAGQAKYFMERMRPAVEDEDSTVNAFCVDCGLSYEGEATKTIYGLEHLKGKEVDILVDGAVIPPQTVMEHERGKFGVVLPWPASTVHVGLPYHARLQSLYIEPDGAENGTTVGKQKLVNRIGVEFMATNSAFIGTSFDDMDEVKYRTTEPPGTPPKPHSGVEWVATSFGYNDKACVCVESRNPVPMHVLGLLPEFTVST